MLPQSKPRGVNARAFAIAENRKGEQLTFSDDMFRPEDKREKGRAIPTAFPAAGVARPFTGKRG